MHRSVIKRTQRLTEAMGGTEDIQDLGKDADAQSNAVEMLCSCVACGKIVVISVGTWKSTSSGFSQGFDNAVAVCIASNALNAPHLASYCCLHMSWSR